MTETRARETRAKGSLVIDDIWPPSPGGGAIERVAILAIISSLLMSCASHIDIPGLSATAQTYAALTIALCLGPWVSVIAVAMWLIAGCLGLPVFANGSGPAYMIGPTLGYLLGFFPLVWIAGLAAQRVDVQKSFSMSAFWLLIALIGAHGLYYIMGLAWLQGFIEAELMARGLLANESSFGRTLEIGLLPFWFGDVVKICMSIGTVGALYLVTFCVRNSRAQTSNRDKTPDQSRSQESGL